MLGFALLAAATTQAATYHPLPQARPVSRADQVAIAEFVGRGLADPFSAQYEWQPYRDEIFYCGLVNAKNQFGAYVGYEPFLILYSHSLRDGRIMLSGRATHGRVAIRLCLEAGYLLSR